MEDVKHYCMKCKEELEIMIGIDELDCYEADLYCDTCDKWIDFGDEEDYYIRKQEEFKMGKTILDVKEREMIRFFGGFEYLMEQYEQGNMDSKYVLDSIIESYKKIIEEAEEK